MVMAMDYVAAYQNHYLNVVLVAAAAAAGEQLPRHCSSWRGVTCDVDGHVTALDLR
jgi:hypothetical protein